MKKTFSLLLCAILALCFTACANNKETIDWPDIAPERGVLSGKVFHSEYTDITFTAPSENWTFASTEELALGCNIDAEKFASEDFGNLLKENATVYDVIAQSTEDKIAILVGFENPKLSAVNTSSAADFVTDSLNRIVSSIDVETNSYELSDLQTVTLCGHEYAKKTLSVETETDSAVQTFYARNMGDYLCIIVTSHTKNTTTEQVEELFS